jgi:hypothetical protein
MDPHWNANFTFSRGWAKIALYDLRRPFRRIQYSLPDGWGRLLLDRTMEKYGIHRGQLNPLDRLAYVGRHGKGALSYEQKLGMQNSDDVPLALDKLAEESTAVLAGKNEEVFEELLRLEHFHSFCSDGVACLNHAFALCVFRSMWAPDSIRSGHQFLFDVGSNSVVMWAAFSDLP